MALAYENALDEIYEAGAFPDRWPAALDTIAKMVGARGGNLIHASPSATITVVSPGLMSIAEQFVAGGWANDNPRLGRMFRHAGHPGFLTDRDVFSADEMRTLPMYKNFLVPNGYDAGAATIVQGNANDAIIVTMEVFPGHKEASEAIPMLNRLRPHIARSVLMGTQIRASQHDDLLATFETLGFAIASLGSHGQVVTATGAFSSHFGKLLQRGPDRLRIVDREGDGRLLREIQGLLTGPEGASLAVRDADKIGRAILHLIPARRDARRLFDGIAAFAILVDPANKTVPGADMLSALFDLTPAEARIARGLALGQTVSELAHVAEVSVETVKVQLKKVFGKTSTRRQSELVKLIANFGDHTGGGGGIIDPASNVLKMPPVKR